MILTGQRRGEMVGLTWSEIDLDKRLISLPRERVKNDHAHEMPDLFRHGLGASTLKKIKTARAKNCKK